MESLSLAFLLVGSAALFAEAPAASYSRVIFSDDFAKDGFGPRWGHYKSGSVVKDGVLTGITPEKSDHPAVDNVKIDPERDLEVSVRFNFAGDKAKSLNLNFDDKAYQGSHASHICNVMVSPTAVIIDFVGASIPVLTPEEFLSAYP